jgi:ribose transport system substrate-binding protein
MLKRTILIVVLLALIVSLMGCQPAQNAIREETTRSPHIGSLEESYYMVAFLKGLDYWKYCYEGFEDAANARGVRSYYQGADTSSIDQNILVLEGIIAKSPSGIAISCVSPEPYEDIIRKAIDSGIQVVTYDSDSENSGRTCFIGTGNIEAGEGAGLRMQSKLPKASIILVYSDDLECSMDRIVGFEKTLSGKEQYNVIARVDDRGDLSSGIRKMKETLQSNQDVDVVFCSSGIASASTVTAIKELGREGIMVIAWDVNKIVLDAIEDEVVESTIAQGMYSMGYWSLEVLFASEHNLTKSHFPSFIDTGYEFITKDSIDKFR